MKRSVRFFSSSISHLSFERSPGDSASSAEVDACIDLWSKYVQMGEESGVSSPDFWLASRVLLGSDVWVFPTTVEEEPKVLWSMAAEGEETAMVLPLFTPERFEEVRESFFSSATGQVTATPAKAPLVYTLLEMEEQEGGKKGLQLNGKTVLRWPHVRDTFKVLMDANRTQRVMSGGEGVDREGLKEILSRQWWVGIAMVDGQLNLAGWNMNGHNLLLAFCHRDQLERFFNDDSLDITLIDGSKLAEFAKTRDIGLVFHSDAPEDDTHKGRLFYGVLDKQGVEFLDEATTKEKD